MEDVAARKAGRVAKVFQKHGRSLDARAEDDPLPDAEPVLASCYAAAAGGLAGSVAVLLEPDNLLSRLCAIIPPPRFHMVRDFGVLSSQASRRREVVPSAPGPTGDGKQLVLFRKESPDPEPRRKPWAWLLRHVFQVDVSTCPACGRGRA